MKSKLGFVTLLSVLVLAGCGGNSDASSVAPSDNDASVTESTLATEIVIGSPTAQQSFVKEKVEGFLKDNGYPNVTVKMYDLAEGDAKNITDWTAAGSPDIYAYASDQTVDLMGAGALGKVPTKYVNEMTSSMKSADLNAAKVGSDVYAYPYAGDNGYYLYYNTDYVTAEDAKSVEGIVAACKKNGLKFGYALDTDSSFFSIGTMFTFGARYNVTLDKNGAIASTTADFNGEKGMKAAKAILQLAKNEDVVITHKGARDLAPTAANGFGAVVEGSWNYSNFKDGKDGVGGLGDKLGCAKLPTITVGDDTANLGSFLGYKLYGVNPQKSSGNNDRLGLLHTVANFLVSDDVQEGRWDTFSVAPTSKKVGAMEKVTSDAHIKAINDQAVYSVAQTIVPGGIWSADSTLVNSIVTNKDTATDADLQGYLDTFNAAVCGTAA